LLFIDVLPLLVVAVAIVIVTVKSILSILKEEETNDVAFSLDFMMRTSMVVVELENARLGFHSIKTFEDDEQNEACILLLCVLWLCSNSHMYC
jgi:hypothetical protein